MTKALLYIVIFTLHQFFVMANFVENNKTNTAVYVNHISSCNYNRNTLELVCVNEGMNTLVQYNNVKMVTMCEYHFCLVFRNNPSKILCNGYQWSHNKKIYDPLTTNLAVNVTNYGENKREINEWFLGYNILTNYFIQNEVSLYNGTIESVICDANGYSTCVTVKSPTGELKSACGGLNGLNLRDQITSFIYGINISLLISGVQYIGFRYFSSRLRESIILNNIVIPCISLVISFIILSVIQSILVKTAMFVIGSFVGIVVGYIVSEFFLRLLSCLGPKVKIESDEEITQEVRMMSGQNYDKGEFDDKAPRKFVIGGSDDDVLDEISIDDIEDGENGSIEGVELDKIK